MLAKDYFPGFSQQCHSEIQAAVRKKWKRMTRIDSQWC